MIFPLTKEPVFPDPRKADAEGLLAYGGDLSPKRLLAAYSEGIFPWPQGENDPLLWFSPDPRVILLPHQFHIARSLKKLLKKAPFEMRCDTAFEAVVRACASMKRKEGESTWITPGMLSAYCHLHTLGFAHSLEAWQAGKLVGGLYGISLGAAFFGESLFTHTDNASKIALVTLLHQLQRWGFHFVDCQMRTHLVDSLGAIDWEREFFLAALKKALALPTRRGPWPSAISPEDLGI